MVQCVIEHSSEIKDRSWELFVRHSLMMVAFLAQSREDAEEFHQIVYKTGLKASCEEK